MQGFRLSPMTGIPPWSIAPHSTRMVCGYRDRTGVVHLFADYLDARRKPFGELTASWDASIAYYTTSDFRTFEDHGTVVQRNSDPFLPDSIGVGSPSVAVDVEGNRLLLFYAARGPGDPNTPEIFDPRDAVGKMPSAVHGRIMLVTSPLDSNGAPVLPFRTKQVVMDCTNEPGLFSTRMDGPSPALVAGNLWLFFKAIGHYVDEHGQYSTTGTFAENRRLFLMQGRPTGDSFSFTVDESAAFCLPGGVEMPRPLHEPGVGWHLFYKLFAPEQYHWEHYLFPGDENTGPDIQAGQLADNRFFNSAGPTPGVCVSDMNFIASPFEGPIPTLAIAAGLDDGTFGNMNVIKQWFHHVERKPLSE